MRTYRPLRELTIARTREFLREPEALFWSYGFPILLMLGLGLAFREGGEAEIRIDLIGGAEAAQAASAFAKADGFLVETHDEDEARRRYRNGKTDLVVGFSDGSWRFVLDPARKESALAAEKAEGALQASLGRKDATTIGRQIVSEPGSRYVDWLIPGLIGMGLMSGGMWGLGYVTVDMRLRKLLKRFAATPMKRPHFLISLIVSRLLFLIPETLAIVGVGMLGFGFQVRGGFLSLFVVVFLGAFCFSGIGLLCACRAAKIEVISGLMNLVMLPMWILSGNFFSAERFPDAMQPVVQALPLTILNNLLRSVTLEGDSLASHPISVLALAGFGLSTLTLAVTWFRWK